MFQTISPWGVSHSHQELEAMLEQIHLAEAQQYVVWGFDFPEQWDLCWGHF